MLSSPPPSIGYGVSELNTQGNPLGSSNKGAGIKGTTTLGPAALSPNPLSPQVLQQNKLAMMVKALTGAMQ